MKSVTLFALHKGIHAFSRAVIDTRGLIQLAGKNTGDT
jgi:hypothetical protein